MEAILQLSEPQNHMLGLVVSLMHQYGLTMEMVSYHYANASKYYYQDDTSAPDQKKYVSSRRAFRDAMANGEHICANYDQCSDPACKCFHVKPEHLCSHAGRNNVCNDNTCEGIVIKACRKGRKCTDAHCSFRHKV